MTTFDPAATGLITGISGRKIWIRIFFDVDGIVTRTVVENYGIGSPYLDTCSKAANNATAQNHVRAGDQNAGALPVGSYQLAAATVKRDAAARDSNGPISGGIRDAVGAAA